MYYVPLNSIIPNPWQPRQTVDAAHIKALADDIYQRRLINASTKGLLQLPVGRLVAFGETYSAEKASAFLEVQASSNTPTYTRWITGVQVQLAFGHSRVAAFQQLHERYPDDHFNIVPVEIVAWDDESMATAAWGENSQRKDLNAADEAAAIQHMMASFDWTQDQASRHLGIHRSTTANKLRLLNLPDDVLGQVRAGHVTERQAIALLPIYALPEPARASIAINRSWQKDIHPENLVKNAGKVDSGTLRQRVNEALDVATTNLASATFPLDVVIAGDPPILPVACEGCEFNLPLKNARRCADKACFDAKGSAWKQHTLQQAAVATGYPVATETSWNRLEGFSTWRDDGREGLALAQSEACPNLRIRHYEHGGAPVSPDFPNISFVCQHQENGRCECQFMAGDRARQEQQRTEREAKEQFQRDTLNPAVLLLLDSLERNEPAVWRELARRLQGSNQPPKGDVRDLKELVARRLLAHHYIDPARDPDGCRQYVKERLAEMGLSLGEPLTKVLAD